jgi:predicted RNA-binding protein with PIN domain
VISPKTTSVSLGGPTRLATDGAVFGHNPEMRERWIVDAMNVIGSRPDRWWNDPDEAMRVFARSVDDHARTTGDDITVVFDKNPGRLPETTYVDVVIARRRGPNAADYEIERLVAGAADPKRLRVVTSDRRLIDKVREDGANVTSSGTFRQRLDR